MNSAQHIVLITVGAIDIGFALAEKFQAAGNRVIIVGRSETARTKTAAALPAGMKVLRR